MKIAMTKALEKSRWWCAVLVVAGSAAGCKATSSRPDEVTATKHALTTSNGIGQNGLTTNGIWANGIWANGLTGDAAVPGDTLRSSPYTRQLLQYIYSCAMPPTTYDTTLDPNNGTLTCSTSVPCDFGYTCSSQGTCVIPLVGAIGVGINTDGTTWGSSGNCDESCQRWVSACVLARTNAYGVHVEISMRAPANAPQKIKDALAVAFAFNVTDRLADVFDFAVGDPAAINAGAKYLLERGYR